MGERASLLKIPWDVAGINKIWWQWFGLAISFVQFIVDLITNVIKLALVVIYKCSIRNENLNKNKLVNLISLC